MTDQPTDQKPSIDLGTKVTVRVGRGGLKNHPAYAERDRRGFLRVTMFGCSCGGTHSGSAAQRAQIVAEGWASVNCGS